MDDALLAITFHVDDGAAMDDALLVTTIPTSSSADTDR